MYTVYTKNNCQQCVMTKKKMKSLGLSFIEINTDDNSKALDMLKSKGVQRLPAVFKGTKFIFSGFRPSDISKLKE